MVAFPFGHVTVTVLNLGHLRADLAAWFDMPATIDPLLQQPQAVPLQCVLLQGVGFTLLLDAPAYDLAPESEFALAGYEPPPDLLAQLAAAGVTPEEVTHVVITHAHFDHFNALTRREGRRNVPTFPHARVFLSEAEWSSQEVRVALAQPDSLEARTLGVLAKTGQLSLVRGDLDLGHGLRLVPAPGETPGHQLLRLSAEGNVLYCLGDLYHHEIEVLHADWTVTWADRDAARRSRAALETAALAEHAWLIATHIPGIGRLSRSSSGVSWESVSPT